MGTAPNRRPPRRDRRCRGANDDRARRAGARTGRRGRGNQRRRHADGRASASNNRGSPSFGRATTSTSIARRWRSAPASWDDCALTVLARVVTRPAPDRIILDCGSKTLTTDQARGSGNPAGYGVVCRTLDDTRPDESLLVERLSEEHATVRVLGLDPPSARRSRASDSQSFVRRVEPRRRGLARERPRGGRPDGCVGTGPDCVVD